MRVLRAHALVTPRWSLLRVWESFAPILRLGVLVGTVMGVGVSSGGRVATVV